MGVLIGDLADLKVRYCEGFGGEPCGDELDVGTLCRKHLDDEETYYRRLQEEEDALEAMLNRSQYRFR